MQERMVTALMCAFIADSLAMPVHWYYNVRDIYNAFPGGIQTLEAAPKRHPSSIMQLHSTAHGGRGAQSGKEVVGDLILKGRRQYWGVPNQHYHQGMQAGDNTLNAHCLRVLLRTITKSGTYDSSDFLQAYVAFMTADEPLPHNDTYAESYHRGFFANLAGGKKPDACAAVTHDTPSVGGLVTIAPVAFAAFAKGKPLTEVQQQCRKHLSLTHPDDTLARVCDNYVQLIHGLLTRKEGDDPRALLVNAAAAIGLDLPKLAKVGAKSDTAVVGGIFSPACYIDGSYPAILFFAYKYADAVKDGLCSNCNVGGDNVHRGSVLGIILGLMNPNVTHSDGELGPFFPQLLSHQAIEGEVSQFVASIF